MGVPSWLLLDGRFFGAILCAYWQQLPSIFYYGCQGVQGGSVTRKKIPRISFLQSARQQENNRYLLNECTGRFQSKRNLGINYCLIFLTFLFSAPSRFIQQKCDPVSETRKITKSTKILQTLFFFVDVNFLELIVL